MEEDQRPALALLDIVNVDAVGVNCAGLGSRLCGHVGHARCAGTAESSGIHPKFLPATLADVGSHGAGHQAVPHREDAGLGPVGGIDLAIDVLDVTAGRLRGDPQD